MTVEYSPAMADEINKQSNHSYTPVSNHLNRANNVLYGQANASAVMTSAEHFNTQHFQSVPYNTPHNPDQQARYMSFIDQRSSPNVSQPPPTSIFHEMYAKLETLYTVSSKLDMIPVINDRQLSPENRVHGIQSEIVGIKNELHYHSERISSSDQRTNELAHIVEWAET